MSAIAYITDEKMLNNHRLYQNKAMNFWRISSNVNFSNFNVGDLLFFLSKSKEHKNTEKEKGIVGFGKLSKTYTMSIDQMWKTFKKQNGYNTLEEFKDAINKVNKAKELPKKISSLYLENVCFFQSPVYLSEYNINISKNIESYTYINSEETVIKLLEYGKSNTDIWSSSSNAEKIINNEEIGVCLALAHKKTGNILLTPTKQKEMLKRINNYLDVNPMYRRISNSSNLYKVEDNILTVIFYNNSESDISMVIGQAILYKKYIKDFYPNNIDIIFKTIDNNQEFYEVVN